MTVALPRWDRMMSCSRWAADTNRCGERSPPLPNRKLIMTLTALDPKAALIVVDLQNAVVALDLAHPAAEIVANSVRLVDAFRARDLPVVLVNATGGAAGR